MLQKLLNRLRNEASLLRYSLRILVGPSLVAIVMIVALLIVLIVTNSLSTFDTRLANLLFLPMPYSIFLRSAEIYRNLRRKGITIRKPMDCTIASVALENDIPLLHNDRDFIPIEEHFGLKCLVR